MTVAYAARNTMKKGPLDGLHVCLRSGDAKEEGQPWAALPACSTSIERITFP
jgi:hypothetical protein